MSFDFLQRRRKLNNSETTGQLPWIHRDDFNIINGTRTNFSVRRLPLSKLTRFFSSPTSLEQDIRSPISLHFTLWHRWLNRPNVTLRFPTFCFSSFFLPSFSLFFFLARTHSLISVFWKEICNDDLFRTSYVRQSRSYNFEV